MPALLISPWLVLPWNATATPPRMANAASSSLVVMTSLSESGQQVACNAQPVLGRRADVVDRLDLLAQRALRLLHRNLQRRLRLRQAHDGRRDAAKRDARRPARASSPMPRARHAASGIDERDPAPA